MSDEAQPIGQIARVFDRIGVAVIDLTEPLRIGDWIQVYGDNTNFVQEVTSMQIEGENIEEAQPGDNFGLKMDGAVQKGDWVYRYVEE